METAAADHDQGDQQPNAKVGASDHRRPLSQTWRTKPAIMSSQRTTSPINCGVLNFAPNSPRAVLITVWARACTTSICAFTASLLMPGNKARPERRANRQILLPFSTERSIALRDTFAPLPCPLLFWGASRQIRRGSSADRFARAPPIIDTEASRVDRPTANVLMAPSPQYEGPSLKAGIACATSTASLRAKWPSCHGAGNARHLRQPAAPVGCFLRLPGSDRRLRHRWRA